ncbi:MAG: hypothetical protein ACFBSE_04955 [Prochloraceae cyanobacterium]
MLKNKNVRLDLGLLLLAGLAAATYSSPRLISNFRRSAPKEDLPPISQIKPNLDRTGISQSNFAARTYLYGQSNLPEQIGQEYLVFKVEGNKVVGALYYPQSEFACFYGKFTSQQLNMNVIHPYDRIISPYSIALNDRAETLALEGYQQLENISDNDRRILNICLEDNLIAKTLSPVGP